MAAVLLLRTLKLYVILTLMLTFDLITADVLAVVNVAATDPVVAADATVVIAAAVAAGQLLLLLLLLLPFLQLTVVTRNDTVTIVKTMPV